MGKKKISVTLDEEVVKEIDKLRGLINRSVFLEILAQNGLQAYKLGQIQATIFQNASKKNVKGD